MKCLNKSSVSKHQAKCIACFGLETSNIIYIIDLSTSVTLLLISETQSATISTCVLFSCGCHAKAKNQFYFTDKEFQLIVIPPYDFHSIVFKSKSLNGRRILFPQLNKIRIELHELYQICEKKHRLKLGTILQSNSTHFAGKVQSICE